MKRVLLALALAGLAVGVAHAQQDNLAEGVFITHYPPGSVYTNTDQCEWYGQYAIQGCDQQNPTIDTADRTVWYVLAAWYSDKQWCGVEFGLGNFDPNALWFAAFGPCPASALAIPSGAWPGPMTGISLAATSEVWAGNFVPVYWFDIAAYYPAIIPLMANPGTGFGGFANCLTPPISYSAVQFGGMGLYTPGIPACPPQPSLHVCCVGEECVLVFTEEECAALGGVFHADWTSCDDNPCYIPPVPAVCCVGHICYLVLEEECTIMEGHWHPEWLTCDDQPCDMYTPAEPSSWGAIKAIYR